LLQLLLQLKHRFSHCVKAEHPPRNEQRGSTTVIIGYIDNVDPNGGGIVASFDGRSVTYGFGELGMRHHPQKPSWLGISDPGHDAALRNAAEKPSLHPGKRLVALVGQKKAIAIAVRNVSGRRRWSKLHEWLSADVLKRYVSE
jgi:exodeoxyribonuclease V alpha subunit